MTEIFNIGVNILVILWTCHLAMIILSIAYGIYCAVAQKDPFEILPRSGIVETFIKGVYNLTLLLLTVLTVISWINYLGG